ncbi:DEKNAAC105155 [Brettanomyces naardenensis]|uniref:DEKNAAC105155 n=1 Tax=Brettanomyces naardenensis TaxID=13370 RepID=A0A448YST9_BRENA|nr:DEKNAAC105155 [Brettanomyces naardenensis]
METQGSAVNGDEDGKFCGSEGYDKIQTHFPSARIKKLMQSDEDIGKVAQATPVALGRALELFMCTLVEKSLETAKQDHVKKVSVQVLKKTIESNEQFDFVVGVCDKFVSKR